MTLSKLFSHQPFNQNSFTKAQAISYFHRGITLLELLVAFSIVGAISVLVASLYLAHFRLFSNENVTFDVATQNKLATDTITNEIRESQAVASTCCSGESSSASELILQLWPINTNGVPQDPGGSGSYDYIIFKLDPTNLTNLIRKIIPASTSSRQTATKVIATGVTGLTFNYNPTMSTATQITINVTTSSLANGKLQTMTRKSTGALRNN